MTPFRSDRRLFLLEGLPESRPVGFALGQQLLDGLLLVARLHEQLHQLVDVGVDVLAQGLSHEELRQGEPLGQPEKQL